jgi:hypothetical protein
MRAQPQPTPGQLRVGRYRFRCKLEEEALLPPFKGSTFRGVFGHALKRTVCALRQVECEKCLLATKCLYAQVFETAKAGDSQCNRATPPKPYVIEPPDIPDTQLPAGASFDLQLLLFGEINDSLAYFIYAFKEIGRLGIGKKRGVGRSRFQVESIHLNDAKIYDADSERLDCPQPGNYVSFPDGSHPLKPVDTIKVTCETPLRLKLDNHLHAQLEFHVLVRALLRRVSTLCNAYGSGEPAFDYRGLVTDAREVKALQSDLRWIDIRRYSNRQLQAMLMGGMTGSVTYRGRLSPYLPLLRAGERLHIGKQSTFGLGKIKVEVAS